MGEFYVKDPKWIHTWFYRKIRLKNFIVIENHREYCLFLIEATEGIPLDRKTLVDSIKSKMFSSTNIESSELTDVKCEPDKASN